ncbi:LLM class flavin-dependent oxidoreductase [Streptomyces morookaense]|uniref:LLM class flavin-dependent oxidoreductase n=1 Tax=Streptomyces morookaense TaxID=1970 RepID=A0A7Y7E5B0_STRMO|nr:LLM class flavin-dependent oxidoreductase [Streptomyces morookaense]NVK76109.1 LLM class flavin-dependent oxidoreductase [Streptomyces morookaense]GHF37425.1 luciferase [Streptomyces morookaense]
MEHGISLLPDCRPARRSAPQYYDDVLAAARTADAAGLSYVKMTEHYLGDYGGYCPSPLTFLAAVAAQTSRIRLMTGCVLPVFHHPVQLAAHAAMVDAISHGRVDIGFARAWLPYEFEAFGVPMDTSRDRYVDTIRAVIQLWTQEKASAESPFFSFHDATSLPPVVQRPHPPVWGAAVRSRESFAWLAEQGFGLLVTPSPLAKDLETTQDLVRLYLETFEDTHEGTGMKPRVAISVPLLVADSDQEAMDTALPLLREYIDVMAEAAGSWSNTSSQDYPGYANLRRSFDLVTDAELEYGGTHVVGSPKAAVERIHWLRESLNADVCLWNVDFGGQDGTVMQRSLRTFIDKVLPHVP